MRKGNHEGNRTLEPNAERSKDARTKIAETACYRAERPGFIAGDHVEDWLAAEKELDLAPFKDIEEAQPADSPIITFHRR